MAKPHPSRIGSTILRWMLHQSVDYVNFFSWTSGGNTIVKTFYQYVDIEVPFPYTIVEYSFGGPDRSNSNAHELLMRVTCHANSVATSEEGQGLIHNALHTKYYNGAELDGIAVPYGAIWETTPVADHYPAQNHQFHVAGGIYQVRFKICEE